MKTLVSASPNDARLLDRFSIYDVLQTFNDLEMNVLWWDMVNRVSPEPSEILSALCSAKKDDVVYAMGDSDMEIICTASVVKFKVAIANLNIHE